MDPFHDPPADLLIAEIPASTAGPAKPSHILVLNKYPIIPNHFILATKEFREQTGLLDEADLAATVACLRSWEQERASPDAAGAGTGQEEMEQPQQQQQQRLFAFFNSGKASGASQRHRHIQFLPVEDVARRVAPGEWRLPLDAAAAPPAEHDGSGTTTKTTTTTTTTTTMTAAPPKSLGFPFMHFTAALAPTLAPRDVHATYLKLYRQAVAALKQYNTTSTGAGAGAGAAATTADAVTKGAATEESVATKGIEEETPVVELPREDSSGSAFAEIDYNLALTTSVMTLCPRRAEHAYIVAGGDDGRGGDAGDAGHGSGSGSGGGSSNKLGPISLNGTILAGTLMLKSEAEWRALRADASRLHDLLEAVGIPWQQQQPQSQCQSQQQTQQQQTQQQQHRSAGHGRPGQSRL